MSTQTLASPPAAPTQRTKVRRRALPAWFGAWETSLLVLVVVVTVMASISTPYFADGSNFSITAGGAIGLALMVIPMTLLMIAGEIDLSIASVFGLTGVAFGLASKEGFRYPFRLSSAWSWEPRRV